MENVNTVSENGAAVAIDDLYTEDEKEIWEDILDYAIWEFCFDVHRAVKLNYVFLDPALDPNFDPEMMNLTYDEDDEKDAQKSKKNNDFTVQYCPNCSKQITSVGLGTHLPRCLGLGGRTNTREVNKKGTGDTEENESENVPSTSSGQSKGIKSKKRRNKKLQKSKAEAENSPRPSSEINDDLESVTYEEKEAFFEEEYDTVSETNKSYMNSDKCIQHTDEERETIQITDLRKLDDTNNAANNDEIDDTANNSEFNADIGNTDDSGYCAT